MTGPVRDGVEPTPRQRELHRQLLGWYLWRTERLGKPTLLPEASLEELLGSQRIMAAWSPPDPSGRGRSVHLTIDASALALEWGAAMRAGWEDRARPEAAIGTKALIEDVAFIEVGHAIEPTASVVVDVGRWRFALLPDEARDLGWAILAALASLLAEPQTNTDTDGGQR